MSAIPGEASPLDVLMVAAFGALLVGGTARLPRIWFGGSQFMAPVLSVFLPSALARGMARAYVVMLATGWLMFLTAIAGTYLCPPRIPETPLTPCEWLLVALTLLIFAGFGVAALVMLVNRPRRLVPPSMRAEPGALEDWRTTFKGWRKGRHPRSRGR